MRKFALTLAAAASFALTSCAATAQTWPGSGPGVFPTIATVLGGERIPAQSTAGVAVNIEPIQLAQYLAANGFLLQLLPPLVNGTCLSNNGTAALWQPCGFGTVTSVGLTLPPWLAVSGSPITSAGILGVTAAGGQPAGQVLASPALASGPVGLRALVATDIPPVNLAGAGNGGIFGVLPIAAGGTGTQTPGLIAGANCTITGAWPNQTVNCAGGGGGGGGTVTTVSVAAANGLSGTVSSPTTTPVITLVPTFTGLALSTGAGFVPATSSAIISLWSGPCNSTTFLRADGTCQTGGGSGGGSVTSVGISMPSMFTVTGSPVTDAGSFTVSLASQSANQVFVSPNGSSGTPGYRALVSADIPTILNALTSASALATVGTITSGVWNGSVLAPAYGGSGEAGTVTGILKGNAGSAYSAASSGDVLGLWSGPCNSSTYLRGDGSCQAPAGSGTVTNVALTMPPWLSVGGSPITGAGTFTVTGTSEPANEVLASPNGSAGALAPRSLVSADIPTLNQNTTGSAGSLSNTLAATSGGTGSATVPTTGQLPVGNSGGTAYAPVTLSGDCALTSAGAITCTKTGGTAFGALATLTPGTGIPTWLTTPTLANLNTALGVSLATYPSGGAGIVNYTGSSSYGTSYSSSFTIPANFLSAIPLTGLSGFGTGVETALGVNVGSAGAFVVNGGALGTPASGSAANLTNLPISGLAGLGSGVGTWLATPTLANLNTALAVSLPTLSATQTFSGTNTFAGLIDSALTAGTSPVCPNGTGGALTTSGCSGGTPSIANNTTLANNSGSTGAPNGLTPAQEIGVLNSASSNPQTGTTYTFVLGDANISVTMGNASSNIVCVPPNSSVAYPVGTLLTVQEVSTGVTSLDPAGTGGCSGSGVTLTSAAYGSSTTQTYSLGGVYGFIQIQQTATNTWNVVAWDTPVGQQLRALAIPSEMQAYLAAHTAATMVATGCTPTSVNNGPFAGKFNLASGPCTSIVITMNGATGFTDPLGFDCSVDDETLQAAGTWFGKWGASADTTTTATIPIPGAAVTGGTDGISWACHPRSL
jgi:hypothetical protein